MTATAALASAGAGLTVGVSCGVALALGEIFALTWRTSVPTEILCAIVLLDVGILAMVGLLSAMAFGQITTVGLSVVGTAMTAVIFPAAAGILMRAAFARGLIAWAWLPVSTVCVAGIGALALGFSIALWLRSSLIARTRISRWEPWAIGCLVCVGGVELLTVATAVYLKPLLSLRAAGSIAILLLLILGTLRGLLTLSRQAPKGVTYGTPALLVGIMLAGNGRLSAGSQPAARVAAHDRPNVILMVLDTLRADHLSAYGYEHRTSPNLERLANESEMFEHAVSPSTWTLPAHASIFTGMSLRRHGVRYRAGAGNSASSPFVRLAPEIPTLAETLGANGYATAAFVANCWYLSAEAGLARGFSAYAATAPAVAFVRPAFGAIISAWMPARYATFIRPFHRATDINLAALEWIDAQDHAPFFLFVNYMETHWPYAAPAPYRNAFPGVQNIHSDFRVPWDSYQLLTEAVQHNGYRITPAERRHLEASYDAALAHLDDQLGAFFDALRQRGLYDRSLLIVTSDHGELFGEHELIGHGADPYEGVTHVPLLIKYPHAKAGRRVREPVSIRRIFPVVLAQAGVAGAAVAAESPESVVSEVYTLASRAGAHGHGRIRRALYNNSLKLIASPDGDAVLYDVSADPAEQTDLSDQLPQQRDLSLSRLEGWLASEPDTQTARGVVDLNPATLEALRALGYQR